MTNKPDNDSNWVVETTAETFERDVFERSHEVPIVVDFWAASCAPCRALGPVLEQLTSEFDGQFVLVKADTDALPEAAARFNVQGISAVYAVLDGEIFDFFTGALPEEQFEEALQTCLSLVERDKAEMCEQARELMVDIFRVLPDDSELTSDYRRRLSMAMY